MRRELLIGCGSRREREIGIEGRKGWESLTTLDQNNDHEPDVVWNLEELPLPFEDDTFDEIHAYEVLEHIGKQGDWRGFFDQWAEFYRILKPGGFLAATCPSYKSMWAWGDPSHTRVLTRGTLVFLDQEQYHKQIGQTPMSDFRFYYGADFETVWAFEDDQKLAFAVRARKPIWTP